jgi:hypothetical protein
MQVKSLVELWCGEEDWVTLEEEKDAPPQEMRLVLRFRPPDSSRRTPSLIKVRKQEKSDRLFLEDAIPIPAEIVMPAREGKSPRPPQETGSQAILDHIMSFLIQRPGVLQVRLENREEQVLLSLALTIWLEGLNKHTFLTALVEMDKTREIVEKMLREGMETLARSAPYRFV